MSASAAGATAALSTGRREKRDGEAKAALRGGLPFCSLLRASLPKGNGIETRAGKDGRRRRGADTPSLPRRPDPPRECPAAAGASAGRLNNFLTNLAY